MIRGGLVMLYVRDVGRAVRFYVETLGMKLVEQGDSAWAVIDAGAGFRIGLQAGGAGESAARGADAPSVGLYPKLPLVEAVAILENRGVLFDRKEEGTVALAHFKDPDGNVLYLCEER
jgi:catechol 2,3-dioxygenase-like lactoylglutathione lyase family enzyme